MSASVAATPLVVAPVDSTSLLAGAGPLEDLEGLWTSVANCDPLGMALGAVGTGLSVASAIIDPLGTALAAGVGWVIDHLDPLKDWLQKLTGDADAVAAFGGTWTNIAGRLDSCVGRLEASKGALAGMAGAFATNYGIHLDSLTSSMRTQASMAAAIGGGMQFAAGFVAFVYGFVRDLIAAIIGKAIAWVAETVLSLGLGLPVVITQVATTVADYAGRAATKINGLIDGMEGMRDLMRAAHGYAGDITSMMEGASNAVLRRVGLDDLPVVVGNRAGAGAYATSSSAFVRFGQLDDARLGRMAIGMDTANNALASGMADAIRSGASPAQLQKAFLSLWNSTGGPDLIRSWLH
jgi:hypothetical protein